MRELKQFWIYSLIAAVLIFFLALGCKKDQFFEFEGGSGTNADPWLIATPKQLDGVRYNLDKHFKQIADIDLSGYGSGEGWKPVGDYKKYFSGSFDGNGFKIMNLTVNQPEKALIALFGYADKSIIRNTVLELINIAGSEPCGGLVGYNTGEIINCYVAGDLSGNGNMGGLVGTNNGGSIINCYAAVDISLEERHGAGTPGVRGYTGGLVGGNWGGDISDSYANGVVSGEEVTGGLVGANHGGNITNCYAAGAVSASETVTGGLVGVNEGIIDGSYALGNVSGKTNVGGLVGENNRSIIKCYATGHVLSSFGTAGGLVGSHNAPGNIEYSYYDKETTGQTDTGKGIPKTTAEMMQQSTFETWDFINIWGINVGTSYPYLLWQEE